jgi:hypothetical protein
MLISGDGKTAVPVRGADGGAIVVTLDEKGGVDGSKKKERDGGGGYGGADYGGGEVYDGGEEVMWERMKRETNQDCHCGWVAE